MELAFSTKFLRNLCEYEHIAQEYLGGEIALFLKKRVADLRAAKFVNEIIAGNPNFIRCGEKDVFSIDIHPSEKILVVSNHLKKQTNIDWSKVYRIKIVEIAGYS